METNYYNAKPSKISNLGADLAGARRHCFDTYETEHQKKARKEAKQAIEDAKCVLKAELAKELPCPYALCECIDDLWIATHGEESGYISDLSAREYVQKAYLSASSADDRKEGEALRRGYNYFSRVVHRLRSGHFYSISVAIDTLRSRYMRKSATKKDKLDHSGQKKSWKSASLYDADLSLLSDKCRGVQFGNSVLDTERAYVTAELSEFIRRWSDLGLSSKVQEIGYSFGARGKAGSVAYYAPALRVISVNRGRVGSLIHEIGHYLDHEAGYISSKISSATVSRYIDKIRDKVGGDDLRYYASKKEIFARAVEEYVIKEGLDLGDFAISGSVEMHPDLCEELRSLVEAVIR